MKDLIERQAAIDALRYAQHRFTVADEAGGIGTVKWSENVIYFAAAERALTDLPSAQLKQDMEFMKLKVRNSNGRPYYSIIYLKFDHNGLGHDFEGYSSYSLDVISDYLKKYFIPSAQLERKRGKWISTDDGWDGEYFVCSECGCPWTLIEGSPEENGMNFCPNCGTDMREVNDE